MRCPHCGKDVPEGNFCDQCLRPLKARAAAPPDPYKTRLGAAESDGPDGLEFQSELGRGGMGVVRKAWDAALQRHVAVKTMAAEISVNPELKEKFLEEARLVAKLKHPNIVPIYGVVEKKGVIHLVFEFVEGRTLQDLIVERGRLGLPEAVRIMSQVADAVQAAHAKNIVHRDLKPSNIMIAEGGTAMVMDFGIAKRARETLSTVTHRQVDTAGTLAYMAPEHHMNRFDRRSDIYSLGIALYQTLTGELPFKGPDDFYTPKKEMAFVRPAELLPDLPAAAQDVIVRCLQADLARRYQTCGELAEALRSLP